MRFNLKYRHNRMISSPTAMRALKIVLVLVLFVVIWQWWVYMFPSVSDSPGQAQGEHPRVMQNSQMLPKEPELDIGVKSLVKVDVYYEALCPDSRHFIMQQLAPTYRKLSQIMDVNYIPYGKAHTRITPEGEISFTCQHGPKECRANKVHACVAKYVTEPMDLLNIITCMIDINFRREAVEAGRECSLKFEAEWDPIEKCSITEEGDAIMHHLGKMTHDLAPKASFIPTILINGSQNPQQQMLRDLKRVVCDKYGGKTPAECT